MAFFESRGIINLKPRSASSMGWFGGYDGNIIGGLMIGLGMTLSGACPGTVLVQLTSGVRSGWFVLMGGVLGGVLHARFSRHLRRSTTGNVVETQPDAKLTLQTKFNIRASHAILAYEATCLAVIALALFAGPEGAAALLHPLVGGALIGAAQAASLLLTGNPVGVSTAYEQLGQLFWRVWDGSRSPSSQEKQRPPSNAIVFALGILAGSLVLVSAVPIQRAPTDVQLPTCRAALGGLVMVIGARIAGGCTSGHGISGMSTLSVSSVITVASMFIGGIALASIMR